MNRVEMGDKIELTALQLLYLLSNTIEEAFERAQTEDIDPMIIANQKTIEIFNRKKEKEQNND